MRLILIDSIVDGLHSNDIGMMKYEVYEKMISRILKGMK